MEDDLWIKKIKDRLDDYSEPLPSSGWEQLEKELSACSNSSMKKTKNRFLFHRWGMAVAATFLLTISSISLWLLKSSVGEELRNTSVPALAFTPDFLPNQTEPATQISPSTPAYQINKGSMTVGETKQSPLLAQQIMISADSEEKKEETVSFEINNENINDRQVPESTIKEEKVNRYHPSGKDKIHLQANKQSASGRNNKRWAVGLSIGNIGGSSPNNSTADRGYMQMSPGNVINMDRMDLSFTASNVIAIPKGQDLIFKDGMPYLQRNVKSIASIEHKQPLSFGISVRKELNNGFSIESGVTYTYLASDITFEGSLDKLSRKLHYIGIPIRANWNFIDEKRFTTYISAGGNVEKCVYGKIGSEKETVKSLQLSVTASVGAQYNVNKRIGLYVEPGISYFFDDGSMIQTIRKENPCNFTLQAGIRLTY
ncbi:outer membrane protein with beta-barrel domain [Bacteroides zoogleoformans]|uniref:Outer membrane protein beta-barrel domain-containing protein n=1 Tax=Bacteroides zoogleoformans TaxID=28119 RepID=A0ABN5IGX1_9BACE|nr:outer membrane beta-barrel protein [Bacteroides zoogleoformans]AVM51866.1 hypothetical protein C4H11_01835 [Bacteroides zoogleoformans]TWJ16959.1 outer membrane protein with beta-barrel domain [Bacteroides zoogleoformans]